MYRRYTLIITEMCNFDCKYCYVKDNNLVITKEVVDQSIKKICELSDINNYYENQPICIDIFGGEPLLHKDLCKYIVNKFVEVNRNYNKKLFHMNIITNGSLLDEDFCYFAKEHSRDLNVRISLDGCEQSHNAARIYKDGRGTFDDVMKNIKMLNKVMDTSSLRFIGQTVISPDNVMYLLDMAKFALDNNIKRVSFAIARDDIWKKEDLDLLKEKVNELADFYIANIDKGIWYDLFAIPIIDKNRKKDRFCAAGKTHLAITPTGDIYPCQRFYNNRSPYKLGDIYKGITNNNINTLFKGCSTYNFIKCNSCEMFPTHDCWGQCMASMYESSQNIFKPIDCVCEIHKIVYIVSVRVKEALGNNENYNKTLNINSYGG